jgi:hypothetical protein
MPTETAVAPAKPKLNTAFREALKPVVDDKTKASAAPAPEPKKEEVTPTPAAAATTTPEPAKDGSTLEAMGQIAAKKADSDKETNIANLRKQYEEAQKELASYKAKATELPPEFATLKEEHEWMSKELAKTNLAATPQFKTKYERPLKGAEEAIRKVLSTTDVKPDEFLSIVQKPESRERTEQLAGILEGLDKYSESKVATLVTQYESTRDARDAELANPSEAFTQYKAQEEAFKEKQKKEYSQLMDSVIEEGASKIPFLQKIEGNEKWNEMVDNIKSSAQKVWNEPIQMKAQAEITLLGTMAPALYQGLTQAYAEVEKLNAELAQYRKSTPNASAGTTNGAPAGDKKDGPKGAIAAFREGAARG